jgi:hypothetical protein
MDEEILYRGLKLIEEVYNESMYGMNDIYRIKDLVHALDKNHWNSKQWLVDELHKVYTSLYGDKDEYRQIFIAGGWYGLTASLLRAQYPSKEVHIVSSDMDPMSEYYGYKLFHDKDIQFRTENSLIAPEISTARVVINTSCEHMHKKALEEWIARKDPEAIIVLQSNNYFSHPTHINCFEQLDWFAWYVQDVLPKHWIAYAGEVDMGDFKRFMVIGQ